MATIVICHGAWGGGWSWRKVRRALAARGHDVLTPTLTGLGERATLLSRDTGLTTHIEDLLAVLFYEDLRDVYLVGHSYGGMVVTGVADRAPERIARIVYLDAFVPEDGQSVLEFHSPEARQRIRDAVRLQGEGWLMPPGPLAPDVAPEEASWLAARRMPQPLKTFEEPIRLSGAAARLPRTYIYCTVKAPGDVFIPFATRARTGAGWTYFDLDSGHTPNNTMPDRLAALLELVVRA